LVDLEKKQRAAGGRRQRFTAADLEEAQIEAIWGRLKWLEPYNTGYRRVTYFLFCPRWF